MKQFVALCLIVAFVVSCAPLAPKTDRPTGEIIYLDNTAKTGNQRPFNSLTLGTDQNSTRHMVALNGVESIRAFPGNPRYVAVFTMIDHFLEEKPDEYIIQVFDREEGYTTPVSTISLPAGVSHSGMEFDFNKSQFVFPLFDYSQPNYPIGIYKLSSPTEKPSLYWNLGPMKSSNNGCTWEDEVTPSPDAKMVIWMSQKTIGYCDPTGMGSLSKLVYDDTLEVVNQSGNVIYHFEGQTAGNWQGGISEYAVGWSPDSRWILISEDDYANQKSCLLKVDLPSDKRTTLYCQNQILPPINNPSISPDGKHIAFVTGYQYIFMVDVATGKVSFIPATSINVQITVNDTILLWSPDSQWIAFGFGGSAGPGIYAMKADGSDLQPLITNPAWAGNEGFNIPSVYVWLPPIK
jgi:hypothetical protein